jgi:acyl-CoA thioesterase
MEVLTFIGSIRGDRAYPRSNVLVKDHEHARIAPSSLCRADRLDLRTIVHGAVAYAMADTGMGGALVPLLEEGQSCATIEIKIVYLSSVRDGVLVCDTRIVRKGSRVAVLESEIFESDRLVSKALGTYSIHSR